MIKIGVLKIDTAAGEETLFEPSMELAMRRVIKFLKVVKGTTGARYDYELAGRRRRLTVKLEELEEPSTVD